MEINKYKLLDKEAIAKHEIHYNEIGSMYFRAQILDTVLDELIKQVKNNVDLEHEIITFGPKMDHDDTIETLYYACLHAFPPNMKRNKSKKIDWYKPKRKSKSWIVA